ncbi:TonB-dependent receptor domain-containing protein [Roseiterribacter gracilis]|uniref:TonB-dependent receptor n=1 Tax=Roseiterribacter gracilis TaxID=2812848 RepID=A0A8S8X7X0_9PROT|nr:TonB-dependent receptor [Rhodospirillales bacterium TMPK1]
MKTTRGYRISLRTWLALGIAPIALAPFTAQAQQAAAQEEIVVTGSRIARPNLTQPNPVQVVNAETIQSMGVQSTIDVVNQLPQTQNNLTPSTSNRFINGAGVSFANLRGLGEYRTLTLVDGKRHVGSLSGRNGSGGTSLVDLNQIPPSLIDRVEVVTGGASAVYGADAVAGVVNIILKKNYEGAEVTTSYKGAEAGANHVFNVNGVAGVNVGSGRGNITFAFDYNHDTGLFGRDRDFALANYTLTPNPRNGTSSDGIPDRITLYPTVSSVFAANGGAVIKTALRGAGSQYTIAVAPNGSGLVNFNRGFLLNGPPAGNTTTAGDVNGVGGDGYNPSQFLTLRVPSIRTVADTVINYQLAENIGPVKTLNFFADVKYSNSRGSTQSTPFTNGTGAVATGSNGQVGSGALAIRADNAYLPADLRSLLTANGITGANTFQITRVNADWAGSRAYNADYSVFRSVVGFNGELSNNWKYEAYYNYGRNRTVLTNKERVVDKLNQQLDATVVGGQIVCRDPAAQAAGCVPINPFVVGPLTAAQYNYAHTRTAEIATLVQENAAVNLSGDAFTYRTPFSGTVAPLSFAVGVEWRREASDDTTDFIAQQPTGYIYGNQNIGPKGSYTSREAYLELGVPVLRDLPFAKAVDLDLAYRYSKYSTSGSANTWNARMAWAINDDVKIRGGVARAVRAPNIDDLFNPPGDNFLGLADPCSVTNINAGGPQRVANCRAAGIPAGYNSNDFGNPSVRTGGNRDLKPEIGSTFTAGAVFTPTFVPGLNITADYWWVRITQGQAALDPNSILRGCYDQNVPALCGLIQRRADGSIRTVFGNTTNIGREVVRGVDLGVSYSFNLDRVGIRNYGDLTVGFDGSWVPENIIIQDPSNADQKLYRGGTAGYPHLRGTFRAVWDWNALSVTWASRFLGEQETFPNTPAEIADFNRVGTTWYHDVSAKYRWRNMTFFGGINNLADKKPPAVPFLYQGSYQQGAYATFPVTTGAAGSYDPIGRAFFVGTSIKF